MENETCQNCKNYFYKDVLKCASCYDLSNWEPRDEKENINAEAIRGE